MEDQELKKYIKDLRDIAIKREVEGSGPNRWWYLSEYSEIYWEKAWPALFAVVIVAVVASYNNPTGALEVAGNAAIVAGWAIGAFLVIAVLPLLTIKLLELAVRLISFILQPLCNFLIEFWNWFTRVN